jgi:hypothetical protein
MQRLFAENGVQASPPNSRGWLSLDCPFCGKPYLGWNVESQVFKCWYCNIHPIIETLMLLLNCSNVQGRAILSRYESSAIGDRSFGVKKEASASEVRWPAGTGLLADWQLKYLQKRGFDSEQVASEWGLRGVGIAGGQYANRIVIPTHLKGEVVSWQARSISSGTKMRYLSCPMEWEVVDNKRLVYGIDKAEELKAAVVVEGPVDVWKLGAGAVHTFGTSYTTAQVKALSALSRVAVMFDNEPTAQRQAQNLAEALAGLGVDAEVVCLCTGKDAGDLPQDEMRSLCKELLKERRSARKVTGNGI